MSLLLRQHLIFSGNDSQESFELVILFYTLQILEQVHSYSFRCKVLPLMAEVDRILRPEGKLIIRDNAEVIDEVEGIARSLHWETKMSFSKHDEGILCVMKTAWRPTELDARR